MRLGIFDYSVYLPTIKGETRNEELLRQIFTAATIDPGAKFYLN